jgi:transcriptional regulator with XRE-family HTH domain
VSSAPESILCSVSRLGTTNRPFAEELPRLLEKQGITLRALARDIGGVDHAYLSRMIRGQVPVNVQHVRRIARQLRLPEDHFPEVREAEVIDAVRRSQRFRDEVYFDRIKKRPRSRQS